MSFVKPKSQDWNNMQYNTRVWIDSNGGCFLHEKSLCPDKNITGNQKSRGNCSECDYFMGHKVIDNSYKLYDLRASCFALTQSK